MRPRRLSQVAEAVKGRLEGGDASVSGVTIDSRSAGPGLLFVAIAGDRTDGHLFVDDAIARGAAGALVRDDAAAASIPTVRVEDPGTALQALARAERAAFDGPVVGVTGANGKTSTKDLTASVLATRMSTHKSPASFNNELGVPLTILGAPGGTEALVVEMGARHLGDVADLARIARPNLVIVTNVGVAHMEVFGSWEAIVESSLEPLEPLGAEEVAVLNADDPVVHGFGDRTAARVVLFGLDAGADVRAEDVRLDAEGHAAFTLVSDGERQPVELAVPGEHMVSNALAAAATSLALGCTPAECAAGLKGTHVAPWRMETFTSADGIVVVNDAYNANPESMAAALRATSWMARASRLCAVLGPMAELGSITLREHERLGELATRVHVDRLVTLGPAARPVAAAAVREGMEPDDVASYDDPEEALADVRTWARAGDVVLFKASRVTGLDRLAEAMRS